jgi:hypothetical protein
MNEQVIEDDSFGLALKTGRIWCDAAHIHCADTDINTILNKIGEGEGINDGKSGRQNQSP